MPLIHSSSDSAFKQNLHTLFHDVGHSPHVQSRQQALAIAYATTRRGRAAGGASPPWYVRNEARNLMHTGPVMSAVPGRTDRHNTHVPGSSYVFPADFVSHLGQSNSMAGMKVLDRMGFNSAPYGASMPAAHHSAPHFPRLGGHGFNFGGHVPAPYLRAKYRPYSKGGVQSGRGLWHWELSSKYTKDAGGGHGDGIGEPTPVVIAGGEYVATPESIMKVLGTDDIKHAHSALDKWVMDTRKEHIKQLRKLPPPVKS